MTRTGLEDTARDLRHGIRVLRRAPGFTAGALLTLALGIGATTAIFSIVRTVMLEPLPYREPDRIVTVWETNRGGAVRNVIAPANFVAWRERTRTLDGLGMVGPAGLTLIVNGQPFEASGLAFSGIAVWHAGRAARTRPRLYRRGGLRRRRHADRSHPRVLAATTRRAEPTCWG